MISLGALSCESGCLSFASEFSKLRSLRVLHLRQEPGKTVSDSIHGVCW